MLVIWPIKASIKGEKLGDLPFIRENVKTAVITYLLLTTRYRANCEVFLADFRTHRLVIHDYLKVALHREKIFDFFSVLKT